MSYILLVSIGYNTACDVENLGGTKGLLHSSGQGFGKQLSVQSSSLQSQHPVLHPQL